jgi:Asp-tRNA(Asn)/Glu-tRNA(Gln) amidotransferase C subunit
MKESEVDAEVVRTLARVAGITLPEEDVEPLVGALRNHLAGMKALDDLDVDEADPIVTFDPRWE